MRRLAAIGRYLELGRDEAQWLALFVAFAILILALAAVFGLALRLFIDAGGL